MYALFAIGTLWFWILMIVSAISIIVCLENDTGKGATLTVSLTLLLLYLLGARDPINSILSYCHNNFGTTIGLFALYLILGLFYSFAKWYFYLLDMKDAGYRKKDSEVQASQNKGTIIAWLFYWPLSMFWTLIDRPFKRLGIFI